MRVLFINSNSSTAYGGVERWMIDAAAGLAARGHVPLLMGRPGAPWLDGARAAGLRTNEAHHGAWAQRVWRVRGVMRAERPDVTIVKAKKMARMAAWGRRTGGTGKVVLFLGAIGEMRGDRWLDRYSWRQIDAAMCVAHAGQRAYLAQGFGPPEKLQVLWKGVAHERFQRPLEETTALRTQLGLAPDDVAIGTVARFAWQKGLGDLFAAVPAIRARVPRARVFVAGDGRDRELVKAAAAELGDAVTLLGQRRDIPALLAAFDVCVLSSRTEMMAQTTLEAMAGSRAVVSTRTHGADEAIEDGVSGVLVPVRDPAALADAVAALALDRDRRAALGRAARTRVEAHFTMAAMSDRLEGILGRVLAGS